MEHWIASPVEWDDALEDGVVAGPFASREAALDWVKLNTMCFVSLQPDEAYPPYVRRLMPPTDWVLTDLTNPEAVQKAIEDAERRADEE